MKREKSNIGMSTDVSGKGRKFMISLTRNETIIFFRAET